MDGWTGGGGGHEAYPLRGRCEGFEALSPLTPSMPASGAAAFGLWRTRGAVARLRPRWLLSLGLEWGHLASLFRKCPETWLNAAGAWPSSPWACHLGGPWGAQLASRPPGRRLRNTRGVTVIVRPATPGHKRLLVLPHVRQTSGC